MSETNEKQIPRGSVIPGFACLGCTAVGLVAFVLGISAVFRFEDFTSAAACLAGSALAFGLLANATLRE